MAPSERLDPIYAVIEYDPDAPIVSKLPDGSIGVVGRGVTTAEFNWPIAQPTDTYTISLGKDISIELDSHFPMRPSSLNVQNANLHGTRFIIDRFFGPEMASAVEQATEQGLVALPFIMQNEQRINLRNLQLESPSTPKMLRRACGSIALGGRVEFGRPA